MDATGIRLKVFVRLLAWIICGHVVLSITGACQESAPVSTSTPIQLSFIVRDRGGNSVQGFKAEELTVLDNGSPVKVVTVDPGDKVPVRLGILLYSNLSSFKKQQEAAIQLLGSLRPQLDQAFVVTQAATNNASAWPDKSSARPWPAEQVAWSVNPPELISFVRTLQWDTALLRTAEIAQKMLALDPEKQFRRVIVEFRDPQNEGMVEWGQAPYKELEERQLKEITEYQRLNATVFTLGLPSSFSRLYAGSPPSGTMSRGNAEYLAYRAGESRIERIAVMTGGRYFPGDPDVKSAAAGIKADIENQFILSFLRPLNSNGELPHKLEIRISRKNVRVSSQSQYYPVNP